MTAGQDLYTLTCEASGGGSMAYYNYTWLRNGSKVSGQNSSTYFSPDLLVNSGQYSCQVSLGSLTVTSEAMNIIVGGELSNIFYEFLKHYIIMS